MFANLLPPAGVALPPELDKDAAAGSGLGGDEELLERGGLRVQYMGKGVKGQIGAPPPGPPPPVVAQLRDALKSALVEVGASADAGEAAAVLTEDGTIAYNQVRKGAGAFWRLAWVLGFGFGGVACTSPHVRAFLALRGKQGVRAADATVIARTTCTNAGDLRRTNLLTNELTTIIN